MVLDVVDDVTDVWGPSMWATMNNMAQGFPLKPIHKDLTNYNNFFKTIPSILPCTICKKHAQAYINNNPPNLVSRQTLVEWVFDFHNTVNRRLKKDIVSKIPEGHIWMVPKKYATFQQNVIICMGVIIAILIIYIILRRMKIIKDLI